MAFSVYTTVPYRILASLLTIYHKNTAMFIWSACHVDCRYIFLRFPILDLKFDDVLPVLCNPVLVVGWTMDPRGYCREPGGCSPTPQVGFYRKILLSPICIFCQKIEKYYSIFIEGSFSINPLSSCSLF